MISLELKIFSLEQSKVLKVNSAQDTDTSITKLLCIFDHKVDEVEQLISIQHLQKNTLKLRNNLGKFTESYKAIIPQINQLGSFISNLEEGEHFYILPNSELDTIQLATLKNHLQSLKQNIAFNTIQGEFESNFGELLSRYNMLTFSGNMRLKIGVSDSSKAICRFCGKSSPDVQFKKKAHAISEALGNKGVICNEECDSCNAKFGQGIETDLIAFLSLFRSFFGIKGKASGYPKIKGSNFSMKKSASGEIDFKIKDNNEGFPESFEAHTNEKVTQQNIYRALCKYVVSVIPNEDIAALGSCVKWINQDSSPAHLPPVYMKIINSLYSDHSILSVYTRKKNASDIPHIVGELMFASIVIVFVMPFSDKDTNKFSNDSDLDKFWELSHYSKSSHRSEWLKMRLESVQKKELRYNINFEQNI